VTEPEKLVWAAAFARTIDEDGTAPYAASAAADVAVGALRLLVRDGRDREAADFASTAPTDLESILVEYLHYRSGPGCGPSQFMGTTLHDLKRHLEWKLGRPLRGAQ
jgi:hypothetical protein